MLFWFLIPLITAYYYSVKIKPILQYSVLLFGFPFALLFIFSFLTEKNKNLIGSKIKERVDRDHFLTWLDKNYETVEFIFHIGARTDTAEFDRRLHQSFEDLVPQMVRKGVLTAAGGSAHFRMTLLAALRLGVQALLDLGLRLGEGSGAAMAWPLLRAAATLMRDMASFAQAGVSEKSEVTVDQTKVETLPGAL